MIPSCQMSGSYARVEERVRSNSREVGLHMVPYLEESKRVFCAILPIDPAGGGEGIGELLQLRNRKEDNRRKGREHSSCGG